MRMPPCHKYYSTYYNILKAVSNTDVGIFQKAQAKVVCLYRSIPIVYFGLSVLIAQVTKVSREYPFVSNCILETCEVDTHIHAKEIAFNLSVAISCFVFIRAEGKADIELRSPREACAKLFLVANSRSYLKD